MVQRDMAVRSHLRCFVVVAALAVTTAVFTAGAVGAATSGGLPRFDDGPSSSLSMRSAVGPTLAAVRSAPGHLPGLLPLLPLGVALALVTLALGGRVPSSIGRAQARIGDDGEDWRSLLLGAPPQVRY
jgi:hypothetical protein